MNPLWLLVALLFCGTAFAANAKTAPFSLTTEEQAWIADHPEISVGIEEGRPFVGTNDDGTPGGIAGDFLSLVLAKTGLKLRVISDDWNRLLTDFRAGKIDLLPATYFTEERATYGLYSHPYFSAKEFLFVRDDNEAVASFADLSGKKLAIVKGFGTIPKIREQFPAIEIVETPSQLDSIYAVLNGEVEALFESQLVIQDLLRQELITGVKGVAQNDFSASNMYFFSRNDAPHLNAILTKALDSITAEERRTIMNHWLSSEYPSATVNDTPQTTRLILLLVIGTIAAFMLLLLLLRFFPSLVPYELLARQFGSKRFRIMALTVMGGMVVLISLLVWYALDVGKRGAVESTRNNLLVTLKGTIDRASSWRTQRQLFLMQLGRDPELYEITKELLSLRASPTTLAEADAQQRIRHFFRSKEKEFGKIGFFLIDVNGVTVASSRDSNLGSDNLIARNRPDLFERVFAGEAVFVPPMRSDVPLHKSEKPVKVEDLPLTMFFAVPVRDVLGNVLAGLTQRLVPEEELTAIMQSGQIGLSGESYLMNQDGVMITKSRFITQLREINLLPRNATLQPRLELRDPGGDMTEGFQIDRPRNELPFTRMATDLLALSRGETSQATPYGQHPGIFADVAGYRDYRGVAVMGAWHWNRELGLGMTTEIDVAEALKNYYSMRLSLLTITAVTLLMAVTALLLTLLLGEKATASMRRVQQNLEERVQRLVQTESRLYAVQENLDRQMKVYRNLFELGQRLLTTQTLDEAFELAIENSNEKLGYDRCLLFVRNADRTAYLPGSHAGYWEEEEEEAIAAITITSGDYPLNRFQQHQDVLIQESTVESDLQMGAEEQAFATKVMVDEYIVMKIPGPSTTLPLAFIMVGNSEEQFDYSTRVRQQGDDITSVGNLSSMISSVATSIIYHAEVEEERRVLEERVVERTQELTDKEARIRAVMESVADGIITITEQGVIESVNRATLRIFGYQHQELIGQKINMLMPPASADHHDRYLEQYLETGKGKLIGAGVREVVALRKGGNEFPIDLSVGEVNLDNAKIYVGAFRDITERKEAEDRLRDAFAVIRGSIDYASRIQRSVLPPKDVVDKLLPDSSILWKPRDIVGGDLYWVRGWKDGVYLILGDCTGHGVPGAFMTLIANGAFEQAIDLVPAGDCAELIAHMHRSMQNALGQHIEGGESDDGIELGVVWIALDSSQPLTFAGARFSLFYSDSGGEEVIEVKGDKKGIAYRAVPHDTCFSNREVERKPGRRFYLTTDGIIDQVGGPKRRMMGKKRFKQLLLEGRALTTSEMGDYLFHAMNDYRGEEARRDDVSMIGFEC
ncbi:MAG: transporter substrate-binding domain-containing protein [Gammaproteobacteria bacterium]|nr:transporter substrate-binding domain-containing protein [Gammaproteobacteria bacterium]